MLLDDDVVTDGQAKPGSLSGWFRREEGVEHLLLYLRRNADAVVANPDLHAVAEVFRRSSQSRLIAIAIALLFALRRRVEAVRDQVQERPCDLLREYIDLTGGRIKEPFHIDLEALLLCAGTMIGEIEAFLDERVDVDGPMLAGTFTRMQQHILDDGVRALAVLNDLVEIVVQGVRQFSDFMARDYRDASAKIRKVAPARGVA